jgi:hypothetical protein
MGWSTYFAFIFSAVNTLIVTYYLAIENIPALSNVFPSFSNYAISMILVGVPILVLFGYLHFKKSQAFTSEQDIVYETSPYFFKLPKGHQREVIAPYQLKILELMEKIITNEGLSDKDKEQIENLKKDLKTLIDGGYIGK